MLDSYSKNYNLSAKKETIHNSQYLYFLLLHTPVAMCIVKKEEYIIDCINPAFCTLLHKRQEELLGKSFLNFLKEETNIVIRFMLESFLLEEYPMCKIYTEIPIINESNNKELFVNIQLQPFFENDNISSGIMMTLIDVTSTVQLRKRLEDNEQRLKLALETSKIGTWEIDLVTRKSVSSYWHENILNYENKVNDWNFDTFLEKVVSDDKEKVRKAVEKSFKTNYLDFQARISKEDGTISWVQIKGQILRNNQSKPVKIIGTIHDITASQERAQKKEELISIVSHELKTPVTSLKGYAQVLERRFGKNGDSVAGVMLKKMVLQIVRLTALIHDLLDTSHIESDKLHLKNTHYFFNEVVDDIVSEIESTVTHAIIVQIEEQIECRNDKERTGQVISNLITNAIKYSPGKDRVIVKVKVENKEVIFSVADFGLGIPVEKQQYIFERFYRVQEKQSYAISGLGLGLYISAEIIKRQGGKIWFESKYGKGSTFFFSLPLNVDND